LNTSRTRIGVLEALGFTRTQSREVNTVTTANGGTTRPTPEEKDRDPAEIFIGSPQRSEYNRSRPTTQLQIGGGTKRPPKWVLPAGSSAEQES